MLTVGSLFSGIGGLDLGLERAGMRVVWNSEIDPYASAVLKKHWPLVPNLGDITKIDWSSVERPDFVCGGFPCQPFSVAGKRAGESDARNLWPETIRCLRELRPRLALLENVPGLLAHRYFGRILGDLAESGYGVEWDCISASAVGAPHRRDRLWIVGFAEGERREGGSVVTNGRNELAAPAPRASALADAAGPRPAHLREDEAWRELSGRDAADGCGGGVGDSASPRQLAGESCARRSLRDEARRAKPQRRSGGEGDVADTQSGRFGTDGTASEQAGRACSGHSDIGGTDVSNSDRGRRDGSGESQPDGIESARGKQSDGHRCEQGPETPWAFDPADAEPLSESYMGRVAHGIPKRVDRLRCLGNAVVPQVAEYVGRRIVTALERA